MSRTLAVMSLLLFVAGCGGSDNPAGPNDPAGGGSGPMSARIDGAQWNAQMAFAVGSASGSVIAVSGADITGRAVGVAWLDEGLGTYTIGPTTPANGVLNEGTGSWTTTGQGSGTIVVTTRTPTRVAGTFTLTVGAIPNTTATGTRNITNGVFNVAFQ
jgi:hypothetical protein